MAAWTIKSANQTGYYCPERNLNLEQLADIDVQLENLRKIAIEIRSRTRCSIIPTWVFELEECGTRLTATLRERSQLLVNNGKTKTRPPELETLRNAIVKIGGLCASGGFALSREAIFGILQSAIKDLEDYCRERSWKTKAHAKQRILYKHNCVSVFRTGN